MGLDGSISFIDLEMAGPNYRGFDIFKLFRRGQPAHAEPSTEPTNEVTRSSLNTF